MTIEKRNARRRTLGLLSAIAASASAAALPGFASNQSMGTLRPVRDLGPVSGGEVVALVNTIEVSIAKL